MDIPNLLRYLSWNLIGPHRMLIRLQSNAKVTHCLLRSFPMLRSRGGVSPLSPFHAVVSSCFVHNRLRVGLCFGLKIKENRFVHEISGKHYVPLPCQNWENELGH